MPIPNRFAPRLGIVATATVLALAVAPAHAQRSVPVEVVNDGTLPVPTQPAVQPINAQNEINYSTSLTAPSSVTLFTVPGDMRLVIETISVFSLQSACLFFFSPRIFTIAGGAFAEFRPPPPTRVYSPMTSTYTHSLIAPVKIYADPGTDVDVTAFRSDRGCTATLRFSFSGYLESID